MLTDTKPEKIGAAVYLPLKGKAREVVRKLTETTIGDATGYAEIFKALDYVYLADTTTGTFTAFKEFYEFLREGGMDFSKFIVESPRVKLVIYPLACKHFSFSKQLISPQNPKSWHALQRS